jgi:hypothetical protein
VGRIDRFLTALAGVPLARFRIGVNTFLLGLETARKRFSTPFFGFLGVSQKIAESPSHTSNIRHTSNRNNTR